MKVLFPTHLVKIPLTKLIMTVHPRYNSFGQFPNSIVTDTTDRLVPIRSSNFGYVIGHVLGPSHRFSQLSNPLEPSLRLTSLRSYYISYLQSCTHSITNNRNITIPKTLQATDSNSVISLTALNRAIQAASVVGWTQLQRTRTFHI